MKENYPIFVHWYTTLDWILATAERFPKNARFSLASRVADEALDTMQLVIEAIYTKERIPLLDRINLSLEKQRVFFRIACDRKYISLKQHEHIARAMNETGRMVGGWRKKSLEKNRQSL